MFRLEYLKVVDNPQLGDLELSFAEENEIHDLKHLYTSVLIGPNGTGKSYILRTVIDLFREINDLKIHDKRVKYVTGLYLIKYWIDGIKYTYGNIYEESTGKDKFLGRALPAGREWREKGKQYFFKKNDDLVRVSQIELPGAILASSIMLADKFIYLSKPEEFTQYTYLGIRNSNSSAGTRSLIKNTIKFLANSTEKGFFISKLPQILDFLELQEFLVVNYKGKRKETFFNGDLDKEKFAAFIENYEVKRASKIISEDKERPAMFSFRKYKNVLNDENTLNSLINFCNEKSNKSEHDADFSIKYDLINELQTLENDYSMLDLLGKLDLISYPELMLKKETENSYSYEGASSGEAHFLTSIIGILATIKENSLILIDEPEISLHPNWQMKYMDFISKAFKDFTHCHFVIATHSHFLISDLKGVSSKIMGLRRTNKIEIVDLPKNLDTFGWSAEEVLYSIFNVRSTRNSFLEYDLNKLVTMVNRNSTEFDEISRILKKISTLVLSDNDPLKILKEKAENYLDQNNA